jgi:predicted  nucleic acid-binding Zn-ribbon protein
MPHQCVRCSKFYEDGDKAILIGCECGGRLFFYIKKEKLEELKKQKIDITLDEKEKEELEHEVFELVGHNWNKDDPVVLDFESIRVLQPGKYELDLVNLFKKQPLIFKLADGKYIIDLPTTFKELRK